MSSVPAIVIRQRLGMTPLLIGEAIVFAISTGSVLLFYRRSALRRTRRAVAARADGGAADRCRHLDPQCRSSARRTRRRWRTLSPHAEAWQFRDGLVRATAAALFALGATREHLRS
jgi:hypothetical protein